MILDQSLKGIQDDLTSDRSAEQLSITQAEPPLVLALDIGTSSVRAALFDRRGLEVAGTQARVARSFRTTRDGGAEADAAELFEQVVKVIDDALVAGRNLPVSAVAISCFWHSLVGVAADGRALTAIFGWADTRAAGQAEELRRRLDEREIHARTGCRFHAGYWPAKLLWLRQQQPDLFSAAARWMSPGEYVALRLSGEAVASVSMASGTGLLNVWQCAWDQELLERLGLQSEKLPPLAQNGETFACASQYAQRWPQLREARWFPAIGDGAANNIGAGCVTRAAVALMIGTSGAMRLMWAGDPPGALSESLWCYRADRRRVVVGGALSDGGGLYAWLADALALKLDAAEIERALAELEPDAHGLTILPFWAGERSTGWSAHATGAILGLTTHTRPLEILRASMEAVAYRFALIAEALFGFAPEAEIYASGGALWASPTWTQLLADTLGRPLRLSGVREASSRGAVLLALEAMGEIKDLSEMNASAHDTVEPHPAHHARYRAGLARQQLIYDLIVRDQNIARALAGGARGAQPVQDALNDSNAVTGRGGRF